MNIKLQICGLVILVFLLILYQSHRRLRLRGEKIFICMLVLTTVCLALDALSVAAIHFRAFIAPLTMFGVCKAYLISLIWVTWINLCYVTLDLNGKRVSHRRLMYVTGIITLAESIAVALLGIDIFESGSELYSYGPAVIATYVFALIYVAVTLCSAVSICRNKNSRRGMAVIMITLVWIAAAAMQFLYNPLLVVGFAMAIGIMILYIVLENPDANLEKQLGCFNSYALHTYLSILAEENRHFCVLDFSVTDTEALEERDINVIDVARTIVKQLEAVDDVLLFKNLSTGLVAISPYEGRLNDVSALITKTVAQYRDASDSVMIFIVRDAEQFGSADDVLKFLTHIRSNSSGRLSALVHVSDSMINQYNQERKIESEIGLALEDDRVEVFFQPICSHPDGRLISAEALARIRNRDGSLMPPGEFVPVAEATGQINALGERVLEKVCDFLKSTGAADFGIKVIDVNLSAVQCDSGAMSVRLSQIVESYGVNPHLINFEITETAVSKAKDALIENMNALVSKGYRFALDDFGKGESNLFYIVELPVSAIKLDMDMCKAFFSNPKAKPVLGAIINMAQKLGMITIAEGIESRDEADGITAAGINYIQGYYYSKPLPADEFLKYLEDSTSRTDAPPDAHAASSGGAAGGTGAAVYTHRIKNILLVEDNEMNMEIARDILEDSGFAVDTAADGTIAVEKVSRSEPGYYHLIFMDIRMPIMDGYEAARRIRSLENAELAKIPIIALTAFDGETDRRTAFEAGMNGHILKPLDTAKLNDVLSRLS